MQLLRCYFFFHKYCCKYVNMGNRRRWRKYACDRKIYSRFFYSPTVNNNTYFVCLTVTKLIVISLMNLFFHCKSIPTVRSEESLYLYRTTSFAKHVVIEIPHVQTTLFRTWMSLRRTQKLYFHEINSMHTFRENPSSCKEREENFTAYFATHLSQSLFA